jgi:O-antigen ligase
LTRTPWCGFLDADVAFLLSFAQIVQPGMLLPALAPFRPMAVLSVLAALVVVLTRPVGRQLRALSHPVFLALVLFVLAQVVSVYYSGVREMAMEVSYWYVYPLFVVLAVMLVADVGGLGRMIWGVVLGGQVVVLYGLYAVWAHLPTIVQGRAGAYGMYLNHNDYTYAIVLTVPFLYMLRRAESRVLVRLLLLLMMGTAVVGVLLSLSRGGMLALVFEGGLLALVGSRSRWRAVAGVMLLGVLGTFATERLFQARAENQPGYTIEDAEGTRVELWKAGKNMFVAHPFLGVGSRRFAEYATQYAEISHDNLGKVSHNTYIEVLSCSGLFGFLPFLALLYGTFRQLRTSSGPHEDDYFRALRLGALVSLCAIAFRATTNAKANDWSFYVLAAIALSCAWLREQGLDEDEGEGEELAVDGEPNGGEYAPDAAGWPL